MCQALYSVLDGQEQKGRHGRSPHEARGLVGDRDKRKLLSVLIGAVMAESRVC